MNIKKLLGKQIKEIRKSKKLTQENVAEQIGIEVSSFCNIENGKYYPTAENLDKIMSVLEVSPSKLFSFEHQQEDVDLIKEINSILLENPEKIKDIYKILKALCG